MSGIPSDQVLAICRIKQWAVDRAALKNAKTTQYQRHGWTQRNNRTADARIVRVMDFERALIQLPPQEQLALVVIYRDGQGHDVASATLDCSKRKLCYLLPEARQHLADVLNRLDLL